MPTVATVADLLSEAGIRVKRLAPGTTQHTRCPKCDGGTSREDRASLSVTIDPDGQGATWICHRGSCGWQDGSRVRNEAAVSRSRTLRPPIEHTEAQRTNRPDWLYEWFAGRNIGARVVNLFGIYAGRRWFNDEIGEAEAIVFPFVWKSAVVNRKYRPRAQKQPQAQEKDALQTLFNADALTKHSEEIVWVEGEPDVLALAECGINHGVTLKDGAPSQVNAQNQARFEALKTHETDLAKVRRVVLAGDNDAPGLALREELARRLGRHRCWIVTWPEGCKDACDVLRRDGPDAVTLAIQEAAPYPIEGVHRITVEGLLALQEMPPPAVMSTGTMASDNRLKLPTEGRLIVVTGIPNHGKTAWTRFVMVHTASKQNRRWCVFSPESQPWEEFVAQCAEAYSEKPFHPIRGIPSMSKDDIREAGTFLADRVTMLVCDAEDEAPTVEWLLERARACVLRDGATDFLVDPWNEVDQQRGDMSETDYIGRCLQRFKAFALRHGCNVWIIAHPAKPPPTRPNEKRPAPGPYDINGSAHWANKTDLGLTVHSPSAGVAELHIWKSRTRRWGARGTMAIMDYDQLTGVYRTPIKTPANDPIADMLPGQW